MKRLVIGFAIGISVGTATAAPNRSPANNTFKDGTPISSRQMYSGNDAYAQTDTWVVRSDAASLVVGHMDRLGLSEDIDYAWTNKVPNAKVLNFVCYSIECHAWARKALRPMAVAPRRPEEKIGKQWKDPRLEAESKRKLTLDEMIDARHKLRYTTQSRAKEG